MTENMRDLVGLVAAWLVLAALGLAYWLVRRRAQLAGSERRTLGRAGVVATLIVVAFAAGSVAIAELFGGVGRVANWLTDRAQVSPLALLLAPVVLIGVVGVVDRVRRTRSASVEQPSK